MRYSQKWYRRWKAERDARRSIRYTGNVRQVHPVKTVDVLRIFRATQAVEGIR